MRTCVVTVEIKRAGKVVQTRCWPAVDVMKQSPTRAWATRQFNKLWKERQRDEIISVYWTSRYGAPCYSHLDGSISGVNGMRHKRGIFFC